jgi:hypothetical protein
MTILNGTHGELRWNGVKIAKVLNVSLNKNRDTLQTTGIGDMDDTFAYGKRSTSGSATILYKTDDAATVQLMNRILNDDETPDELTMVLRMGQSQGSISGTVLLSSQSESISTGENTSVSINFVISGKPIGVY